MADIKKPKKVDRHQPNKSPVKKESLSRSRKVAVFLLFVLLIASSSYFALDLSSSAKRIYRGFKDLAGDIAGFGGSGFENSLNSIGQDIDDLGRRAELLSLIPQLKEIPGVVADLKQIVSIVANLGAVFSETRDNGLSLAFNGEGEELLKALKIMSFDLGQLEVISNRLLERVGEISPYEEKFNGFGLELLDVKERMDALIIFLDVPQKRNIILLFENPSELRPSGGFAGSYGELALLKGGIEELVVNDIYYPDKFLTEKVVPPLQLQGITPDWGARDTNWFFDFSLSSRKLLEYLEKSDVYKETDFDGVISINVRVVEDILRLTGPIKIPEYNMELGYKDFLREIQEQVVEDRAPGQNPKEVLKYALPALIEAVGNLKAEKKAELLNIFTERARRKDVKFYFEDERMQAMVAQMGVAGQEYNIENGFVGDYLAVVNANIAGGKTDVFVDQRVVLESKINSDGFVQNRLLISRRHWGGREPEIFYNQTNKNFLRIFTVPTANLSYIEGGFSKQIEPLVNYNSSFEKDPDLSVLENTRTLLSTSPDGYAERYMYSGKRIFGTWFDIEPGENKSLELRYSGQRVAIKNGQQYKFILDKQSGSEMMFEYTLVAPEAFIWAESGTKEYRYQEKILPARLEIILTLQKK